MRLALALLATCLSTNAFAGGFGVLGTAGFKTEHVYFYDTSKNFAQYRQTQNIAVGGTGLEFVLGDRDDRILGVFRGYWLQEGAQRDPAEKTELVAADSVLANYRESARNVGMASVGLQWGVLGQPDGFQVALTGAMGSGFLTTDHTEFVFGELGGGASYQFARDMQAYANVLYVGRYHKGYYHGANAYAGVRYLFD